MSCLLLIETSAANPVGGMRRVTGFGKVIDEMQDVAVRKLGE